MIKEIQKSIRLINFTDSIFDQPVSTETFIDEARVEVELEVPGDSSMLKAKGNTSGKFVEFEEALKRYFSNEIDKTEQELLKEILVCHWPFLKHQSSSSFNEIIKMERERVERIEWKCFGTIFREAARREEEILHYYKRIFLHERIEEINVLSKQKVKVNTHSVMNNLIDLKCGKFDSKAVAKVFSLMEVYEYICIDPMNLYSGNISDVVFLFNRFTNFLISSILLCDSKDERKLVVMRILKLAKEFREIGAMNSLKSCLAALESNSIHRLNVIEDQSAKYKNRYNSLSTMTSPKGNFSCLRETACLVPWFGIILKDFTFIRELANESKQFINIPLSLCTRKLLNSITEARDTSIAFYQGETFEMKKQAAVMKFWLKEQVNIVYETEEDQYNRSLIVSLNK